MAGHENCVSLYAYVEMRFRLMTAHLNERNDYIQKRIDAANEWREAMKDREALFASKTEMATLAGRIGELITQVNAYMLATDKSLSSTAGSKLGISSVGAFVFGAILVISSLTNVAVALLRH